MRLIGYFDRGAVGRVLNKDLRAADRAGHERKI